MFSLFTLAKKTHRNYSLTSGWAAVGVLGTSSLRFSVWVVHSSADTLLELSSSCAINLSIYIIKIKQNIRKCITCR